MLCFCLPFPPPQRCPHRHPLSGRVHVTDCPFRSHLRSRRLLCVGDRRLALGHSCCLKHCLVLEPRGPGHKGGLLTLAVSLLVNKSKGLFLNPSRDSASFNIVYDPFLMLISSLPRFFFSASNPFYRHSSNFLRRFLSILSLLTVGISF